MSDKQAGLPCGVIIICTDDSGRVIATASDFDRSGPGGFRMREAQAMRARRAIKRAVCEAYCSPVFAAVVDDYDLDGVLRRLKDKGWKVTEILIGSDPTEGGTQK